MEDISDRNPDLDKMKERGWAWIQRNSDGQGSYKHGAPYANDEYAAEAVERLHPFDVGLPEDTFQHAELIIVSWE